MADTKRSITTIVPPVIFITHFLSHCYLSFIGWTLPFELFNILLLISNFIIMINITKRDSDFFMGISVMLIILSHGAIGQKMAPDALTSGSILMVNILILYVAFKIKDNLSKTHFTVFVASYFALFFIFIKLTSNAEPIFLLSLMGLAATARSFKLLPYFWAIVLSFTICQPYPWQAMFILFFLLKIIFSIDNKSIPYTTIIFLLCGLSVVFLVLLPVMVIVFEDDTRNIILILKDIEIRDAIYTTIITATISTSFLAVFCLPMAYAVSRTEFFGKNLILSLIDIPIIIPQSAAGIALSRVFSKQQYIGEICFNKFGIQFDGTMLGVILAQVFVAMPFIVKSALSAFESVPKALEDSAKTLGAPPLSAFLRIAVPLASRGLLAGCVLAWARAAGEFGAVLFIAPYPQTAPIAVYNRFNSVGIVETAPLVTLLILFSLCLFFILQFASRLMPKIHKTAG